MRHLISSAKPRPLPPSIFTPASNGTGFEARLCSSAIVENGEALQCLIELRPKVEQMSVCPIRVDRNTLGLDVQLENMGAISKAFFDWVAETAIGQLCRQKQRGQRHPASTAQDPTAPSRQDHCSIKPLIALMSALRLAPTRRAARHAGTKPGSLTSPRLGMLLIIVFHAVRVGRAASLAVCR